MKRDLAISGLLGLLLAAVVFWIARSITSYMPRVVQDALVAGVIFVILLLIAIVEMPMMVIALRQMIRGGSTPRAVILGTNVGYIAFASVYAAACLLVTGENGWSLILAGLSVLRFASGVFVR